MPQKQLALIPNLESGNSVLAGGQAAAYNVCVDGRGAIRRRPALVAYSEAPATALDGSNAITGLFVHSNRIFATTAGQKVFAVAGGGALDLSASGWASMLAGTRRPTFALWRAPTIVIASGLEVQKVDPVGLTSERLGGSPPVASEVVSMSQRIILNEGTSAATRGAFRYCDAGQIEVWDALRRADTEADSDDIVALRSNMNELFAFCERSLQVFSPDPTTVWAVNRSRRLGCAAAASVIEIDERFAWLDPRRRIIESDGRDYEETSGPIGAVLDGIETVSDCFGYRVMFDQFDCAAWCFPSDGRTFVRQIGGAWSQWSLWRDGVGHVRFPVNAHFFRSDTNVNVVGLTDGRVCKMDSSAGQDLDGTEIKAEIQTGFEDHETSARKTCKRLTLMMNRGLANTGRIRVSWRDDFGSWSDPLEAALGPDVEPEIHFYSLGVYRKRQWRIEMSDAADFVLAGAIEEYSVEGN